MNYSARPPRPDVTYLSRRRRPDPASTAPAPGRIAAARMDETRRPAPSPGLTLERPRTGTGGPSGAGTSAPRSTPPAAHAPVLESALLFDAPRFTDTRQMAENAPLVRLNARQSGIGTLLVHGARSMAWEDSDQVTGAESVHGETAGVASRTAGNRKLVAFHDGSAAITLRHVKRLRRAIFIAQDQPLVVSLFGEAALAVAPTTPDGRGAVLYISRIDNLLELRAEYIESANDQTIWAAFGFTMTTPTHIHTGRR